MFTPVFVCRFDDHAKWSAESNRSLTVVSVIRKRKPIMLRLESDLVELCLKACDGKLDEVKSQWKPKASFRYRIGCRRLSGDYRKGDEISGLPQSAVENEKVLAGVEAKAGKLVTNGGRVLCATALGESVFEAQQKALKLAEQIQWTGRFYRRDIGYRAVEREQQK